MIIVDAAVCSWGGCSAPTLAPALGPTARRPIVHRYRPVTCRERSLAEKYLRHIEWRLGPRRYRRLVLVGPDDAVELVLDFSERVWVVK